MVIPHYLVPYLLKNDDKIARIEKDLDCKVIIHKDSKDELQTAEGIRGSFLAFIGTPKSCSKAIYKITKELIHYETDLNGTREK